MLSQRNIGPNTPMGATPLADGATFRAWAPRARKLYVNGTFDGVPLLGQRPELEMVRDDRGYWSGFLPGARSGDLYRFYVIGSGSSGYQRDPYAREMARDFPFPECSCVLRPARAYPWHDEGFVTPDFADMIIYQLHIGTYVSGATGATSTFLDVIDKIPYLVDLGINVLQPLPVDELESRHSMGYNGADYFSPDLPYLVHDRSALERHRTSINRLLSAKGHAPLPGDTLTSGPAQLQAMIDLCHVHGIAVVLDVVYNHAGGFDGDSASLYYWDRVPNHGDNNDSLYFTDQDRGTGGLSFALWNQDVRQFIINNARYYLEEFHVDGFRYDEISGLLSMNKDSGWSFCRDLTDTLRAVKPRLLQNAEYWPFEFSDYPRPSRSLVSPTEAGGAGFDVLQHDGLRSTVRQAVGQAAAGAQAHVNMNAIAANLFPAGLSQGWQAVTCVENHDIVKIGAEPRLPALADSVDRRSWYARSRSRVATGLLLLSPGIPQLFMGQEFLEDKPWDWDPQDPAHLLWWQGLNRGADRAMSDHLRFTQDLVLLRRRYPALRGERVNAFHVHDDNRVLAFHRWLEGRGQDVIVAASLAERTWYRYHIGFPCSGLWSEIFNSDVYDHWMNPQVAGNAGAVYASGPPLHGFTSSAEVVIPANGVVVFARATS